MDLRCPAVRAPEWDQLTTAEETRDVLRIRAERAEIDLDTARTENQRLAEQIT